MPVHVHCTLYVHNMHNYMGMHLDLYLLDTRLARHEYFLMLCTAADAAAGDADSALHGERWRDH